MTRFRKLKKEMLELQIKYKKGDFEFQKAVIKVKEAEARRIEQVIYFESNLVHKFKSEISELKEELKEELKDISKHIQAKTTIDPLAMMTLLLKTNEMDEKENQTHKKMDDALSIMKEFLSKSNKEEKEELNKEHDNAQ